MRVLMICDDYWHPGKIPIDGVTPLAQSGFEFDTFSTVNDLHPDILEKYPVVLLCKSDEISQTERHEWKTPDMQRAFINYVEKGGGLLAVHSATVPGKNTAELEKLIGCRFIGHPNACPVTVQPIKEHPVTAGVGMFCEPDEHYRLEMTAQDVDIILASYSPPQGKISKYESEPYFNTPAAICPAGYVRTQGKGRICVLTPGHTAEVWSNLHFRKLLTNALTWCAKQEV